jgi:hypothetical protein
VRNSFEPVQTVKFDALKLNLALSINSKRATVTIRMGDFEPTNGGGWREAELLPSSMHSPRFPFLSNQVKGMLTSSSRIVPLLWRTVL